MGLLDFVTEKGTAAVFETQVLSSSKLWMRNEEGLFTLYMEVKTYFAGQYATDEHVV